MLHRFLVVAFAFALAASVGALFLAIAAATDPIALAVGAELSVASLFAMMAETLSYGAPLRATQSFSALISAIFIATCVAPLAIAVAIGEAANMRGWLWYAAVCAFLAAASPWLAQAAHGLARANSVSAAEGRFALLFFLTGAVTGTVYWLIAARGGRRRPPA